MNMILIAIGTGFWMQLSVLSARYYYCAPPIGSGLLHEWTTVSRKVDLNVHYCLEWCQRAAYLVTVVSATEALITPFSYFCTPKTLTGDGAFQLLLTAFPSNDWPSNLTHQWESVYFVVSSAFSVFCLKLFPA